MENQEYDIYDIITGQKISKEKIVPGKIYIIYYPNEKWKVRSVVFDSIGKIVNEEYIKRENRNNEVIETLKQILEKQGNKEIEVNYSESINIEETQNGLQINLPVYYVKYIDKEGIKKERILEASSLKDIQMLDNEGNKELNFSNEIISSVQIGRNNRKIRDDDEMTKNEESNTENQRETDDNNHNNTSTPKEPLNIYFENVDITGETSVSRGNMIVHIKQDGQTREYDLRSSEGVKEFRNYLEQQKEI